MNTSRFMTSEGLMPSTIFDKGDADMDVSEEMEEVRELLYEMIKKNFPMGVSSSHLAQKYYEEYVSKGLGRELPEDWLVQVAEAEEFEAQTRGPLTILFVRLSNTNSFKRPPIPHTDVKVVTSGSVSADVELIKLRKDRYPLQHAETLSSTSIALTPKCDVIVVAFETSKDLHVRAASDDPVFESMKSDMRKFYADNPSDRRVQIYEVLSGGAYALCDAAGNWFRVVTVELPRSGAVKCFFCDVGVFGVYPVVDLRLLPDPGHPIMSCGALAKRVSLALPDHAVGDASDEILRSVLFEKDAVGNLIPVRMQDPMPDYMYDKLAEECQMPDAQLDDSPRPGGFYAALINDRWERVQCVRASKIDKAAFCVYLIDVGAFHYVRSDVLRRLNAKTPFRKMLMFKCKVAHIVPFDGQDVWSRESHEAVREFFEAGMGETVMVTPLPNSCGLWKQMNAPSVPLVTANISCCGRDLADWLISRRLALPEAS
ncbi:tudor domain protein [Ancylostoma duodenale]|uniref:Tudor domain protein n=1 Tax=Ancylostoma duodenale TaxID=51022 RepID=A0A0C2H6L9_9BILA|nr:tudor domain protein [Ancylostoma duodenale]